MKKENSPAISVENKQPRDQPLVRSRAASRCLPRMVFRDLTSRFMIN